MYSIITKKSLIAVLTVFALTSFSLIAFFNHSSTEKTYLPTHLNERPQFLYGVDGNELDNPMGVAVDAHGSLYISDPGSHQIKVFQADGKPIESFGDPGLGKGQLNYPYGLAINNKGNLLVADSANRRILLFTTNGKFIKELVPSENKLGLVRPGALTVDGDLIYISDLWGHQVVVVDHEGQLVRKFGSPGNKEGQLKYPQSVLVDAQHRTWVADTGNNRIQIFNQEGKFLFSLGGKNTPLNLSLLRGMATDSLYRVLIADAISSKILVFDSQGNALFSFGGLGSAEQQLRYPMSLWIAQDGRIYIADRGNHRIQVWGYKGR